MKTYTVTDTPVAIGPGTEMVLTAAQFGSRSHLLEAISKPKGGLHHVRSTGMLHFKIGESIQIEGVVPKNLVSGLDDAAAPKPKANGNADDRAVKKARADGVKTGRAEMLAEIEQRNAIFEAADNAADAADAAMAKLDAEQDPEKRKPLQKALDAALEAQAAADKKVADLPELKA